MKKEEQKYVFGYSYKIVFPSGEQVVAKFHGGSPMGKGPYFFIEEGRDLRTLYLSDIENCKIEKIEELEEE